MAVGSPEAPALAKQLARAVEEQYEASVTPRFPVNYAFSTRGTELCVHTVRGWFEAAPEEPKISDDKVAMYNSVSRVSIFKALHERAEFQPYIPLYRVLYARPARIFLARGNGEFTVPRVHAGDLDDDDLYDDIGAPTSGPDDAAFVELMGDSSRDGAIVLRAVRSCCGVAQGCPAATFGACLPLHLSFHRVQKEYPTLNIVGIADDAYYSGSADVVYPAFDRVREIQRHDLHLESNMRKVKAINPLGGVANIPHAILAAQGGELAGLKCVGACVAPPTPAGDQFCVDLLITIFTKRLAPLARVDTLELARKADGKNDYAKLRYDLQRHCAHAIFFYWMRCMPPHTTRLALAAAVDGPLRRSFELLTRADTTPLAQRAAAWDQATLPLHMGGVGIGGHSRLCPAAYTASLVACWPHLVAAVPAFSTLDILTSDLPMLASLRVSYAGIRAERDHIAHTYASAFDSKL